MFLSYPLERKLERRSAIKEMPSSGSPPRLKIGSFRRRTTLFEKLWSIILHPFLRSHQTWHFIHFSPITSRPRQAWDALRAGEEGGHQDHQQGQVDGVGAAEGRAGDRHHEADRAPPRPRTLRRLREQEVPVSAEGTFCISPTKRYFKAIQAWIHVCYYVPF